MADRSTSPAKNPDQAFRDAVAERLKNPDDTNAADDSKSKDAASENEDFVARVRANFSDRETQRQRAERFEERRRGVAAPAEEASSARREAPGKAKKPALPAPPADPLSLSELEVKAGYEAAEKFYDAWLSVKMARDLEGVTEEPDEDPDEWDEAAA